MNMHNWDLRQRRCTPRVYNRNRLFYNTLKDNDNDKIYMKAKE
jgi:hypothetical protein